MTRIALFLGTNIAVLLVLNIVARLFGVDRMLAANGMHMGVLLVFAAVIGVGGSFISLLMSKTAAKFSTGAQVIENPRNESERWLVESVRRLSEKAGIGMPEVAVYDGAPNAFATGAFKNSALVAVSTGLLDSMTREEVEAVLGHEISHISNGDMVTLTLIQGVLNTFVVFFAKVVGSIVDSQLRGRDNRRGPGVGYFLVDMICQVLFGILASIIVAWFSRYREYRADAGSARLLGRPQPMIAALQRLGGLHSGELPKAMAASGIAGGIGSLFASHPPLEARIAALQQGR